MKKPEVFHTLCISTAHIPLSLSETLTGLSASGPGEIGYGDLNIRDMGRSTGWLIHIPPRKREGGEGIKALRPPAVERLTASDCRILRRIFRAARKLDCRCVWLDPDAPKWRRLPRWEW